MLAVHQDKHYVPRTEAGHFSCAICVQAPAPEPIKLSLGIALDISASMEPILDTAKEALRPILDKFDCKIVAFNDTVHNVTKDKLTGLKASGSTNLGDAVMELVRDLPDGPVALVIMTDGRSNVGPRIDSMIEAIRDKVIERAISINTFSIGDAFDAAPLARLAMQSAGGSYNHIAGKDEIAETIGRFIESLKGMTWHGARLNITMQPGARITRLEGYEFMDLTHKNACLYLGALYSGITKRLLLKVSLRRVPARDGPDHIADITLQCGDRAERAQIHLHRTEAPPDEPGPTADMIITQAQFRVRDALDQARGLSTEQAVAHLSETKAEIESICSDNIDVRLVRAELIADLERAINYNNNALLARSVSYTLNRGGYYDSF